MKPLTEQARANVEAGATDGPGTMTCRKCGGDKESSRLNSSQCKSCQREIDSSNPAKAKALKTDKPTAMRSLRTVVPPETFGILEREAQAKDVTLAAWVRDVLIAHTAGIPVSRVDPPTAEEWAHFTSWMNVHGLTPQRIKEETGLRSRRAAIDWAKDKGYQPGAIAKAGNETAY